MLSYSDMSILDKFLGEGDTLLVIWKYIFCSSSGIRMLISFLSSEYIYAEFIKFVKFFFDMDLKRLYFLRGHESIFHWGHIFKHVSLSDIKIIFW